MARTKAPVDGAELVEKHWPYDGPHSGDSVIEAARAMSTLATYLGNATGPGNGKKTLQYGPQVYRVVGALSGALASLDQVLEQLATAERRIGLDPTAYDDRREKTAAEVAAEAAKQIEAARQLLFQNPFHGDRQKATVHTHLAAAHSTTSRIGHERRGSN